jgi:hypothetical protein
MPMMRGGVLSPPLPISFPSGSPSEIAMRQFFINHGN